MVGRTWRVINVKKQLKDFTIEELENNVENPKLLELLGLYTLYNGREDLTLNETYNLICKLKEILEQEIEVKE